MGDAAPLGSGAIITAAGASQRMKGVDKVFAPLAGKPALAWVVEVFQTCSLIKEIVIVLAKEKVSRGREMAQQAGWNKVTHVCPGGPRRQDSVCEGLQHLGPCDYVVIHDGARPCLTVDLIELGLAEARATGAAIAAIPASDTVKQVDSQKEIVRTIFRNEVWLAQTPQVFKVEILKKAYQKVAEDVTDDAGLVERLGHKVRVYMGSYQNIKITTKEDLALAESILLRRSGARLKIKDKS